MIGVGMVGTGFWANMIQLPVFAQIPDFEVIGVLSREPANARKTAENSASRKPMKRRSNFSWTPSADCKYLRAELSPL